jgi:hypothetical protein
LAVQGFSSLKLVTLVESAIEMPLGVDAHFDR